MGLGEGRTTKTNQRAVQARLDDAGRRIDRIASRALEVRDDIRVRVERRVHALRAREAAARSQAQAAVGAEPRRERSAMLGWELDEIAIEISIAEAQLDLDSADDGAAFEAAVGRQIDAYRALAEVLDERGTPREERTLVRGDDLVEAIRLGAASAVQRLQRYRHLSNEVSDSLRAGVLVALDDLDRAAAPARSTDHE